MKPSQHIGVAKLMTSDLDETDWLNMVFEISSNNEDIASMVITLHSTK